MGNFALSPLPAVSSYSITRDRPIGDMYVDANSVAYAF